MTYTVIFLDTLGTEVRRSHATLARAAQDAKTAVNAADGAQRAVIRDVDGKIMWSCEKPVNAGSSTDDYRDVMRRASQAGGLMFFKPQIG